MPARIYLDNAASSPLDPRVREEMLKYMSPEYGNPSSLHRSGRLGREAVEACRERAAKNMGADPSEIVFTSSGTESNNLALKGIAFANRDRGSHIIISSIEHDCVLNACRWLEKVGFEATYLPVDSQGLVDPDDLKSAIRSDTILVSIIHGNNEIGTVQPIAEFGRICRGHGICFHTDACQSYGKTPIRPSDSMIDIMTINAHKIHGPKGAGALFIRKGARIEPLLHGGGHEKGIRSSTENIAGIAGLTKAMELCAAEFDNTIPFLIRMRESLILKVLDRFPFAYVNGSRAFCLPNIVNFGFHGYEGEAMRLLLLLDEMGIEVSTGSACSSNASENKPSHVLAAIGLNPIQARGALRISLGRFNIESDIDSFINAMSEAFKKLHSLSNE
jgi:cysteine desulfurase